MKATLTLISAVALGAVATAQTFTTQTFNSNNMGTVNFVQSGNSYRADMLNFGILPTGTDIAWVFDYTTPVAYTGVRLTITGVIAGDLLAVGNEKVYDTAGPTTLIANGLLDRTVTYTGTGFQSFSISETYNFSQPSFQGQVQKNFLFATPNSTGWMYSIQQDFIAVPEPATMAVFGLGVAALLKRRNASKR